MATPEPQAAPPPAPATATILQIMPTPERMTDNDGNRIAGYALVELLSSGNQRERRILAFQPDGSIEGLTGNEYIDLP